MILNKIIYFFIIFFFTVTIFSNAKYEVLDKIIVKVGQQIITKQEMEYEIRKKEMLIKSNASKPINVNELRKIVLDELIEKKVVLEHASRIGIEISNQEIEYVINNIIKSNEITLKILINDLKENGTDLEKFKNEIKDELIIKKVKDAEIKAGINVSDYEVDALIKEKESVKDIKYEVLHILIKKRNTHDEEKIKQIQSILTAENFQKIAQQYSDGPNALNGGNLGLIELSSLPDAFQNKLKYMKEGEISDIFESPNGFHIIKLEYKENKNKIENIFLTQYKFQEILIKKNNFITDNEIKKKLQRIKNEIKSGLSFQEAIIKFSDDKSLSKNDKFEWINENNLFPEFQEELRSLSNNEISEPIKTSASWHLIKKIDQRNYDVTNDSLKQQARLEIINKKINSRYSSWVKNIMNNYVIQFIEE